MTGLIRSLLDLSRKSADLRLSCCDCGHARTVAIGDAMRIITIYGWSTGWHLVARRLRCRRCGSKPIAIAAHSWGAAVRKQRAPAQLSVAPTTLRPGLKPPPPGVTTEEWNAATDRERWLNRASEFFE